MPSRTSASSIIFLFALGSIGACGSAEDNHRAEHVAGTPCPPCPVLTRGGECRAIDPNEVVTLASNNLFAPGAGFPAVDGSFRAFGVDVKSERVVSLRSDRPWQFDEAEPLEWSSASGATGATVGGQPSLYFVGRVGSAPSFNVSRLHDGQLAPPDPVIFDGTNLLPTWPQAVGLPDGHVLLAFVEPQRRIFVGVDDGTGKRFTMGALPVPQTDLQGVLAHVGTTTAGSWVLTYQVADPSWHFSSFVVTSHDCGATWSAAVEIDTPGDDVSDAFPIARSNGGADIYYVRSEIVEETTALVFKEQERQTTIRRRVLHEDGTLGPAQLVTSKDVGEVATPQPRRLPDGRIAMMLTIQRSAEERVLSLAVLDGDAP